jgi:pyruvate,orthophosphate dikinase
VIFRTLDPPLHEFLPRSTAEVESVAKGIGISEEKAKERAESLKEVNPMLGHRGVRLGISDPKITEMQVRAIMEAAFELKKEGIDAIPEIMIPVVAFKGELDNQFSIANRVIEETAKKYGMEKEGLAYKLGTMIELPAAALEARTLAGTAEFFSFGTNDLTQTTLGLSRDDTGKIIDLYLTKGILPFNPFVTLHPTVVKLMRMAVEEGRRVRNDLEIGICGEHGRDPESIKIAHWIGLDYVSPSGDGVLIARLVAAQAKIEAEKERLF